MHRFAAVALFSLMFLALPDAAQAPATPDEALRARWEAQFRTADVNEDRRLDRTEAEAGLPRVLHRHFDEIDLDHDDHLTPEELWAMHAREVEARAKRRAQRVGSPARR